MKRYKYDQYEVYHKHHIFKVVVFPKIDNIWFIDSHPAESTYDCDGDVNAIKELARAFAIVIKSPLVVVYLPIKNVKGTFHMVLTRHSIDGFKPSVWYQIKPKLQRSNQINNYVLNYEPIKLRDYCRKFLMEGVTDEEYERNRKLFVQKELGDTVFCQYSLSDYYQFHDSILDACDVIEKNPNITSQCWGLGWVYSDEITRLTKEYYERNEAENDTGND